MFYREAIILLTIYFTYFLGGTLIMSKVRPPRKKQTLDIPGTAVKILKKADKPLMLKDLHEIFNNLDEVKNAVTLSVLHNELNFDGRFIFLKNQGWVLKTQAPEDESDILE